MRRLRPHATTASAACALAALVLSACGGGESQDADEPEGEYRLSVVFASFPARQALADRAEMRIEVRNEDDKVVPNVAVTVEARGPERRSAPTAFGAAIQTPGAADVNRPVWIVDAGPRGGEVAHTNTWALGRLEPGQSKTFRWRVTPVKPGRYTVGYEVAPGLEGKARTAGGARASGAFRVRISGEPADARVDDRGRVIRR